MRSANRIPSKSCNAESHHNPFKESACKLIPTDNVRAHACGENSPLVDSTNGTLDLEIHNSHILLIRGTAPGSITGPQFKRHIITKTNNTTRVVATVSVSMVRGDPLP